MSRIKHVSAREILDSRGNPTVEASVLTGKCPSSASVPSGASKGVHEAVELRDGGKRYHGKGVLKAVKNVNTIIARALKNKNVLDQEKIDKTMLELDGTNNKSRLGANAILAVSLAACRSAAHAQAKELYQHVASLFGNKKPVIPVPAFNLINGGKHAGNKLDLQEYLLIPHKTKNFCEALRIGAEVYQRLKELLEKKLGKKAVNVGDEGGFAPPLECFEEPLDYICDAVQELGYWNKVSLGIDAAATTFYKKEKYELEGAKLSADGLAQKYVELANAYPIISIEDPFFEEDFEHSALLTRQIGKRVQIVGDDLLCTNTERVRMALEHDSCNALLLKPNQAGTLTEAFQAARLAMKNNWNVMVSHRSGDTTDDFIADLAVGIGATQIKAGAPCRGERVAKYNRLLQIEQNLGKKARYGGKIR